VAIPASRSVRPAAVQGSRMAAGTAAASASRPA
jgi:hypothetical protein